MADSTLKNFYHIYKKIQSILAAILFASIGNNILMIILPINLSSSGVLTSTIGWVMAGYSAGIILGSKYGHLVISRIGHNRSYAAVAAIISICAVLHIFITIPLFTFVLRLFVGGAMAMIYVTLESWLSASSESNSRGVVYGFYQLFFGLGALCAPFISALLGEHDMRVMALVSLMLCLSLIPLMLTRFPSPVLSENSEKISIIEILRDTPSGAVTIFCVGLALSALLSLIPLLGYWMELSPLQLGSIVAAATGSSIVFQIPVGWVADRVDERKVILALMFICFIASLLAFFFIVYSLSWNLILLSIFVMGGCFFCLYPIAVKFIFNQIDSEKALPVMSTLLVINGMGMILGPIIASQVMQWFGPPALFLYFTIIMSCTIPFMIYRVTVSRDPSNDEENVPYIITMQMLRPINTALDPRVDYLMTPTTNTNIKSLAYSIGISPSKAQSLIKANIPLLDGFQPSEFLVGLVLLKPRLSKPILRAMLNLYPDQEIEFTVSLKDLISLNKTNINRMLYLGLTHKSNEETQTAVGLLFNEYTTPVEEIKQSLI